MQSIKGEKSAIGTDVREGEVDEEEHAVHQFQVAGEKMIKNLNSPLNLKSYSTEG